MVVALLGILKAGAAYLPLDLSYPPERVAFMLEDAAVPVLLVQERLRALLPMCDARVVALDADWDEIAERSAEDAAARALPDSPAYVIYTSGSTGRPKGVVVPHRGLVNYLSWCTKAYAVGEGGGSIVHSPVGFDLTVTTLFSPLLAGRSVLLVPEEQGVEGLRDALHTSVRYGLVKITPSHLEVLSQLLPPEAAADSASAVVIGGEALWAEQLAFWREHAPATRLINEYGPTEAVVGCCTYEVPREAPAAGSVPVGRPIANARIYLLDSRMSPTPTYVAGELYIGGDCLARGYLNRPALTAEKFVPDPFGDEPGRRLYRTGDLARHLPDGNIEFLGRADQQVKIRGFRVELGEIEAVLTQHPGVREAVAALREESHGDRRLVAYIVPAGDEAPAAGELRGHLQGVLPEYMVPSTFVTLDALPLTPNGKVDRGALPAPEGLRPQLAAAYVAPQSETERVISSIWQDVLQIERVGVYDNFFDLGGHSLLMVRVNRRLRDELNQEVSMIDLFRYPTVSALAEFLSQEPQEAAAAAVAADSRARVQARKDSAAQQRELRERRRQLKSRRGAQEQEV
jgi:amino acid adenylation domain-containing protein